MNFNGSYKLNSDVEKVWLNLNNPEILKKCIDGCREFSEITDNKYKAKIVIKLGPVNASFISNINILNIKKPESYEIEAKGNAGSLGFASGNVKIFLKEINDKTILSYDANSKINGKLAQLGSRLIDGSVKKNTERFFQKFEELLNQENDIKNISQNKIYKSNKFKLVIFSFIFLMLILIIFLVNYGQ